MLKRNMINNLKLKFGISFLISHYVSLLLQTIALVIWGVYDLVILQKHFEMSLAESTTKQKDIILFVILGVLRLGILVNKSITH